MGHRDSITVKRKPSLDKELANKTQVADQLEKNTVLRYNLKCFVGNDTYSLTKNDRIQITDTTNIEYPNSDGSLLQNWVRKCNDKNNNGKLQNFLKSTKTNSSTSYSGATNKPLIGNSSMRIETSQNNSGSDKVLFVLSNVLILYKLAI